MQGAYLHVSKGELEYNLSIYSKDRPDGYGGVFIAHSNIVHYC